jgi:hypothetical protein
MSSFIEQLMKQLGDNDVRQISQQVGAKEEETAKAIPEMLSLLTEALARNSSKPEGAKALSSALEKDHDGSILDNISSFINDYQNGPGDGILKHVLGPRRKEIEEKIGQEGSLDMGSISKLLTMLAPIIMGFLGRSQRREGMDVNSLINLLGGERKQAQRLAPRSTNLLSQLLDADGDGQIADDVGKIGLGFLGRLLRRRK